MVDPRIGTIEDGGNHIAWPSQTVSGRTVDRLERTMMLSDRYIVVLDTQTVPNEAALIAELRALVAADLAQQQAEPPVADEESSG